MKTKHLLHALLLLQIPWLAFAQKVGINTNNPQASLDVRGNERIGGLTHFLGYDSASGKIDWRNSNLYVPVSQCLMQHSAAADGLFYNNSGGVNGQLEYRNAAGQPVFFTNFTNGNGYFRSRLGIATTAPLAGLHVADSSVLFSAPGDVSPTPGLPAQQGVGRRMMWYADKAAFRAGQVGGSQWDKDNIGNYSVATGAGTIASQGYSTAMGFYTKATGVAATALGNQTTAKAFGALSVGSINDITDNPDPYNAAATDRLFQIGNGIGFFPSNAMTVLRNGDIGVGTTTPSALLDLTSTTKGFLPPRMTMSQRNAINGGSLATGLIVYCLDCSPAGPYCYNGATWQSMTAGSGSSGVTYTVGQFAQGGIIFWVDDSGQHGLVSSVTDIDILDGITGDPWWNAAPQVYTNRVRKDGIYIGRLNTDSIIARYEPTSGDIAAAKCARWLESSYGDWYLPSYEELRLLRPYSAYIGGFSNAYYWSSTEVTNASAYAVLFGSSTSTILPKSDSYRVRAIRRF